MQSGIAADGSANEAYETYRVLPYSEHPYSEYDLSIVGEVLRAAESQAKKEAKKGTGSGELTLLKLLKAYEVVLPKHSIIPEEDIYYYRLLLKLSLDPDPDWGAKFRREYELNASGRGTSDVAASGGDASPRAHVTIPTTINRQTDSGEQPSPPRRIFTAGTAVIGGSPRAQYSPLRGRADVSAIANGSPAHLRSRIASSPPRPLHRPTARHEPQTPEHAGGVEGASSVLPARQQHQRFPNDADAASHESTGGRWPRRVEDGAESTHSSFDFEQQQHHSYHQNRKEGQQQGGSASPRHDSLSIYADQARFPPRSPPPYVHTVRHAAGATSASPLQPSPPPPPPPQQQQREAHDAVLPAAGRRQERDRYSSSNPQQPLRWPDPGGSSGLSPENAQLAGPAFKVLRQHARDERGTSRSIHAALDASSSERDDYPLHASDSQSLQRLFARWRRAAPARLRQAVAHWSRGVLQQCLREWRRLARTKHGDDGDPQGHRFRNRLAAHAGRSADVQPDRDTLLLPLTAWRQRVQQRKHRTHQVFRALSHWMKRTLRLTVRDWRILALEARHRMQHAQQRHRLAVGRVALDAWRSAARQLAYLHQAQATLAWHHMRRVQRETWRTWHERYEQASLYHTLLRCAYTKRRLRLLQRLLTHWRAWAPAKRAARMRQAHCVRHIQRGAMGRVLQGWLGYIAVRRYKAQLKQRAADFYCARLVQSCLRSWIRMFQMRVELDGRAAQQQHVLQQRRLAAALRGWVEWLLRRRAKAQLLHAYGDHLTAGLLLRCIQAWLVHTLRAKQLSRAHEQVAAASAARLLARYFAAWDEHRLWKQHRRDAMEAAGARRDGLLTSNAYNAWREYALRKRQQRLDANAILRSEAQRVLVSTLSKWRTQLLRQQAIRRVSAVLRRSLMLRCLRYWKGFTDRQVDWRSFQQDCIIRMHARRTARLLQLWQAWAERRAGNREAVATNLERRAAMLLQSILRAWHDRVLYQVAKKMKQLTALLHWERGVTRNAVAVWCARTAHWRQRRQHTLRARLHRRGRLLEVAVTTWTRLWVTGKELQHRSLLFLAARQRVLLREMTREWQQEAWRLQAKAAARDSAETHFALQRLTLCFEGWRSETRRISAKRDRVLHALTHWSKLAMSRAFAQWRDWALWKAALHRKAKGFMSVIMGKHLGWAFFMLRAYALKKRKSKQARTHALRRVARQVLHGWRLATRDAREYHAVLADIGAERRRSLLSSAVEAWRGVAQKLKQKQQMNRMAAQHYRRTRKRGALRAWRRYLVRRRRAAQNIRAAAKHCRHHYLRLALDSWRRHHIITLKGHYLRHSRKRSLVIRMLREWRMRAAYKLGLREVEDVIRAKRRRRVLRFCISSWRQWLVYHHHKRHRHHRALSHNHRRLVRNILGAWRELVQHERLCSAHRAGFMRRIYFQEWRAVASRRAYIRHKLSAVVGHWSHMQLARAFNSWVEHTRLARIGRKVLSHWTHKRLWRAWQAWREGVTHLQRRRHITTHMTVKRRAAMLRKSWDAWQFVGRNRKEFIITLKHLHRRWRHQELTRLFRGWRQLTLRHRRKRSVLQRTRRQLLLRCFGGWQEYAWTAPRIRMAEAFRRASLLQRGLQGWEYSVDAAHDKREAHRCAQRLWTEWRMGRAFLLWRERTYQQQRLRRVGHLVLNATLERQLGRAWNGWRLYVMDRLKKRTATAFGQQKRVAQVFYAWRDRAAARQSKLLVAHDLRGRILHRMKNQLGYAAMAGWRDFTLRRRKARRILMQIRRREERRAFNQWRAVTTELAHWRRVYTEIATFAAQDPRGALASRCCAAVVRWQHYPVSAAWQQWREYTVESLRRKEACGRACRFRTLLSLVKGLAGFREAVAWARKKQLAAWNARWRRLHRTLRDWAVAAQESVHHREQVVKAVATYINGIRVKAWTIWVAHVARKRRLRYQLAFAMECLRRLRSRRCFDAWLHTARWLRPKRLALADLQARAGVSWLRSVLRTWLLHARLLQLHREISARHQQRTLTAAVTGWRGVVHYKAVHRSILEVAAARRRHVTTVRAFGRWLLFTQERRILHAQLSLLTRRSQHIRLTAAFRTWRDNSAGMTHERRLLMRALGHWLQPAMAVAFNGWRAHMQFKQQLAARAERQLRRVQSRALRTILEEWREEACLGPQHRQILHYFRVKHTFVVAAPCLLEWRIWASGRTRERRAVVYYWNSLLVRAFGAWCIHHEAMVHARVMAMRQRMVARRVIAHWRHQVQLAQRKRAFIHEADLMHVIHVLRRGLHAWMSHVHDVRLQQAMDSYHAARLAAAVLRHWRQAAILARQLREDEVELMERVQLNEVMRVMLHWRDMVKAAAWHQQARLRTLFRWWLRRALANSGRRQQLRDAVRILEERLIERVFYAWRYLVQVRLMREVAFARKQRALRDAVLIGDQIARRRNRTLLASCFTAWHIQVNKYRRVAARLAALLHHSLRSCFLGWKDYVDQRRVLEHRAVRLAAAHALRRSFNTWRLAAAELHNQSLRDWEVATQRHVRSTLRKGVYAWTGVIQLYREQRGALRGAFSIILEVEQQELKSACFDGWKAYLLGKLELRVRLVEFVRHRDSRQLQEVFTVWQKFAAAMRADIDPASPFVAPRTSHQDRLLVRRLAAMDGAVASEMELDEGGEEEVVAGVPLTRVAVQRQRQQRRQAPYVALARGLAQRRATRQEYQEYDDVASISGFDLTSVAGSMQQQQQWQQEAGPSNVWELPDVRLDIRSPAAVAAAAGGGYDLRSISLRSAAASPRDATARRHSPARSPPPRLPSPRPNQRRLQPLSARRYSLRVTSEAGDSEDFYLGATRRLKGRRLPAGFLYAHPPVSRSSS